MRLECLDEPSSSPEKCKARFEVLQDYMKKGGYGAELGVFKGGFVAWLMKSEPTKLYLVDPWFRVSATWDWAKGDSSTVKALLAIISEYRLEIERGIIEPRIEFSQEFFQLSPDDSLDWVYIDSTHGYNQTKLELIFALTKVREDGFIMGDDYRDDPNHKHYGVYRAVKEFEAAGLIKLLVDGKSNQFVAQRT